MQQDVKQDWRVTLLDVARDAHVSRATASLVMRGSGLVADETRQAVLASMQKLGYVYHRAAGSLRSHRSQIIGLVVTDITNPFFAELTVSISAQLEQAGYAVLLLHTSDDLARQNRLFNIMLQYPTDGVILCPAKGTSPAVIGQLVQRRLPLVLVTRYLDESIDYVGGNNTLGAEIAVSHLLSHGHRRIAFIGGPADSSARRDRLAGYRRAHAAAAMAVDDELLITSAVTRAGGYQAAQQLLALPHPPRAALCYNDIIALGAMLGLQAAGRSPGDDFAVIGFDNIADAALSHPPLSTVSLTAAEIGERAARLILERIEEPGGKPQRIMLVPEMVIRTSCGCHPA